MDSLGIWTDGSISNWKITLLKIWDFYRHVLKIDQFQNQDFSKGTSLPTEESATWESTTPFEGSLNLEPSSDASSGAEDQQQQQEEQRRIQMQQEEEARAAAEMRRQQEEAERQRQEQMQRQQQEEQMRIQQKYIQIT